MSWTAKLSKEAAKEFRHLPRDRQKQIGEAIEEMKEDPLRGDVRPVKSGKFKGTLRKRVGRYRIVFALDPTEHHIEIAAILTRTEKTYR